MYKNRMTRKELLIEQISEEVYLRILCEQYGYDPRRLDEAGFRDYLKGAAVGVGMTLGGMSGQAQAPATAPAAIQTTVTPSSRADSAFAQVFGQSLQQFKKAIGIDPEDLDSLYQELQNIKSGIPRQDSINFAQFTRKVQLPFKVRGVLNPFNVNFDDFREGIITIDIPNRDTLLIVDDGTYKISLKNDIPKMIAGDYRYLAKQLNWETGDISEVPVEYPADAKILRDFMRSQTYQIATERLFSYLQTVQNRQVDETTTADIILDMIQGKRRQEKLPENYYSLINTLKTAKPRPGESRREFSARLIDLADYYQNIELQALSSTSFAKKYLALINQGRLGGTYVMFSPDMLINDLLNSGLIQFNESKYRRGRVL